MLGCCCCAVFVISFAKRIKFRVGQRLLKNDSKDRQRLSCLVIYLYVLPCYSYYVGTTLSDDSRFHFMLWDFVESNNRRMKKKR